MLLKQGRASSAERRRHGGDDGGRWPCRLSSMLAGRCERSSLATGLVETDNSRAIFRGAIA